MNTLPPFLLLDLDDTILRYDGACRMCWHQVCREYAPRLQQVSAEDLIRAIEDGRAWFWSDPVRHQTGRFNFQLARRAVVDYAFEHLGQTNQTLAHALADDYTARQEAYIEPFAGAIEWLEHARAQGTRMAMVTNGNSTAQRRKIERFGLAVYFDAILIEGEFGVGKPDHRIFQQALDLLHAPCRQTWMIGNDLAFDIRPALELGLGAIWVDEGQNGLPENSTLHPTRTIASLAEL